MYGCQNKSRCNNSAEQVVLSKKNNFPAKIINPNTRGKNMVDKQKLSVREPVYSGSWYPGQADKLQEVLSAYFANVSKGEKVNFTPIALVSPHAGFVYSGQTAAYGFKALAEKKTDRIIVIAPSHRTHFNGAALPEEDFFRTPLGDIPVDLEAKKILLKNSAFKVFNPAHSQEHSLEIQLPFLQARFKDFKLVPLVIGEVKKEGYQQLVKGLKEIVGPNTILVASSDFTHYGPNFGYLPFTKDIKNSLEKLDLGAVEFIEKCDFDGLYNYHQKTGITVCGIKPILLLLKYFNQDCQGKLIKYQTSGAITGDYVNSVSYCSIVLGTKEK